jgi:hypothetical protein
MHPQPGAPELPEPLPAVPPPPFPPNSGAPSAATVASADPTIALAPASSLATTPESDGIAPSPPSVPDVAPPQPVPI